MSRSRVTPDRYQASTKPIRSSNRCSCRTTAATRSGIAISGSGSYKRRSNRAKFGLHFPALAVGAPDQSLRFRHVGDAQVFGVPLEFFAEAYGHVAEQNPLDEWPGNIEIGTSRRAAFAGANPILMRTVAR